MMGVFDKIISLLKSSGVSYELLEHKPVYTSLDASSIRDTNLSMGAKALVFMADKKPILVVLPGDKKVDTSIFKKSFGIKDFRMASKEEVKEITSLEVGAIPPLGSALNLASYFDEIFKEKDMMAFNAGSHTKSIKMKAADLLDIEKPVFGNYAV